MATPSGTRPGRPSSTVSAKRKAPSATSCRTRVATYTLVMLPMRKRSFRLVVWRLEGRVDGRRGKGSGRFLDAFHIEIHYDHRTRRAKLRVEIGADTCVG